MEGQACVCVYAAKVHANIKGQCELPFQRVCETAGWSRSSHTPFPGKYQFEDDWLQRALSHESGVFVCGAAGRQTSAHSQAALPKPHHSLSLTPQLLWCWHAKKTAIKISNWDLFKNHLTQTTPAISCETYHQITNFSILAEASSGGSVVLRPESFFSLSA